MKGTTERLADRCSIYGTVQQFLQPEAWQVCKKTTTSSLAVASASKSQSLAIAGTNFVANLYHSALDLPKDWDKLAGGEQAFLSRNYLLAWSEAAPEDMEMAYVVAEQAGEAVGIVALQLMDFRLSKVLKSWNGIDLRHKAMVCGAAQVSGPHGFAFSENLDNEVQAELLMSILQLMQKQLNAASIVLKDLKSGGFPEVSEKLNKGGYVPFDFEPNMVMEVPKSWRSLDDYIEAMTSKYRIRVKRALRKGGTLGCRSLTVQDLRQHKVRMFQLYQDVADRSEFSLVKLRPDYFEGLKAAFGPSYKVIGFFDKGDLVGFCSVLKSRSTAEVHFLGFDDQYNSTAQLYLNMLLNCIRTAIEDFNCSKIIFGRTATVIKSSVGARVQNEQVWLWHSNRLVRLFLPLIVKYLQPSEEIDDGMLRHPFG